MTCRHMKRLVRVRVSPSGQSRARLPLSQPSAEPIGQNQGDNPIATSRGRRMPVIPRARSLSRAPLSPQGPRCFSGFFRARPPPLRAVPAKLARNNRLAAPPCRKTSGCAFASPLRRAGARAPSAPAPGDRQLTRHSRLRKEREDDEGEPRGRPCSPRGRSDHRASQAHPRRGTAGARRRERPSPRPRR